MTPATDLAAATSEQEALHAGCGLVDRSERGKLAVTGSEAKSFLQGQVTNDVEGLEPGRGLYAAFLTHKGKMLGDLRILDAGDELLLDCERPTLQELFNLLRRTKLGRDAELDKRTLQRGLLSLIGPEARRVAGAGATGLGESEHDHAEAELGGAPVRLIAAGGGDVDVLCLAEDTERVAAALREAGAIPVSEDAAEVVRVERGRPRYGHELDDTVIPQEAGLNQRAVSFTKGCYVGQETVARLHYRGKPNRHLRGLRLAAAGVEPGTELRLGEKVVGRVGTVADSPAFGPIALAIVRREAAPGDSVAAGETTATVVELPFR
ncbi:MAG: folate-binding protein [Actinomycetota bacterium]|nr:folate-binding protein [Actinomycetota bacterium]